MAENFKKKFRGYAPAEVDAYITGLKEELNYVNTKASEANKKIEALQTDYTELKRKYDAINQNYALILSREAVNEKANEEIARLALKEASELINKAKRNANMILKESMEYVKGLSGEVDGYKDQAKNFREEIVKMSQELLETIDKSEIFSLINEEENTKTETVDEEDL